MHHSLADGIANVMMMTQLSDNPSKEDYPNIFVRFSGLQGVFVKLCIPFYLIWLMFKMLVLMGVERNGIKSEKAINSMKS